MPTQEEIEEIVKIVANRNDITDAKTVMTRREDMAKHYIGDLIPLIITGQQSGKTIKLHIVIKMPQHNNNNPAIDEFTEIFFNKEIFTYSKLLPAYKALETKAKIDHGFTSIQCYHHNSERKAELLVLKDMRPDGYQVFTESMFLDKDRITLAIKEVAKFHALSFVLESKNPEIFAEFATRCKSMEELNQFTMFSQVILDSLAMSAKKMSNEEYKSKVAKCSSAFTLEGLRAIRGKKVICHNDLWRNNILFQYQGTNPVSACLLDYQLVQLGSPAMDLLGLISACTDHKVRRLNYGILLRVYHQTLANTLTHFSMDVNRVYPFQEFKEDLVTLGPLCLVRGLYGLETWFGVGGIHNVPDYVDKDGGKVVEGAGDAQEAAIQCQQACEHLIADYIKYGYI